MMKYVYQANDNVSAKDQDYGKCDKTITWLGSGTPDEGR